MYWWTKEIAVLRKNSLAARRIYQRTRKRRGTDLCRPEQEAARAARKLLRSAVKRSQEECWRKLCELVEHDPWGLPYRIAMNKLQSGRMIPELTSPGRMEIILTGLFPHRQFVEWKTNLIEGQVEAVTAEEVKELARCLPTGKAPGPDGVPDVVVREVALAKAEEVASVFNYCLESGVFPEMWKTAKLMLIRKPGKPLDLPSSYRPLSLINSTAKLFERVLKNRLEALLSSSGNCLSEHQFGLRRGRSTMDALEKVTSIVRRAGTGPLTSRELCVMVAIDVANAFNSAPWHRIGEALASKGVPKLLTEIIRDYLSNRRLLTESGEVRVSCGVPQGSVIGPLLWNVFYDGLLRMKLPTGVQLVGFADDIAVVGTARTTDLLESVMNSALEVVARWMDLNGLQISVHKTQTIC